MKYRNKIIIKLNLTNLFPHKNKMMKINYLEFKRFSKLRKKIQ